MNEKQGWQSHRIENRIPRFFRKNIASNYRIKTTKKIASVIALQNLTKKSAIFSIILIFLSLILLVSFVWLEVNCFVIVTDFDRHLLFKLSLNLLFSFWY